MDCRQDYISTPAEQDYIGFTGTDSFYESRLTESKCLEIRMDEDGVLRIKYKPYGIRTAHNCREWKTNNNYITDCKNYYILSGCENRSDNTHYRG